MITKTTNYRVIWSVYGQVGATNIFLWNRWREETEGQLANPCWSVWLSNRVVSYSILSHILQIHFGFYKHYCFLNMCTLQEKLLFCTLTLGGWWRWALVSPGAVAPSRVVGVSASVNLPLHHKVQKFSSGTGSPGWSRKKGCKTVVMWLTLLAQFAPTMSSFTGC